MFARSQRIRTTKEILFVLRKGRRLNSPALSCYFVRKPATLGKVGIIVDTKVSKKAVTRNLMKRRIRAALRETGLPQAELMVRVNKAATTLTYAELKNQLVSCLPND